MALTQISTQGIKDGTISSADLADQSVTLAKLPHGTSSNDGKFLRANNGADPTFETVSSIGGSTGVDFDDNVKARFGTGNDLEISHSGNHSFIKDVGTGSLFICSNSFNVNNAAANETIIKGVQNGAVELYFDNSQKFRTESAGVVVSGDLRFPFDNHKILLGASQDLQIYHDGTHSYVQDSGTGNLIIAGSAVNILNAAANESMIRCTENGSVELWHDNSKKLETQTNGVTVQGSVFALGTTPQLRLNSDTSDGSTTRAMLGMATGANNFVNGSAVNDVVLNCPKDFIISHGTTELMAVFKDDSSVELYCDSSKKFETTANGIKATGDDSIGNILIGDLRLKQTSGDTTYIKWDASHSKLEFIDDVSAMFGDGNDLQIYHDGSDSYIDNSTGDLFIRNNSNAIKIRPKSDEESIVAHENGAVELFFDNSKKIETISTGIQMSGDIKIQDNHRIKFGAGEDLQIYTNGTAGFIDHVTTGTGADLILRSKTFIVRNLSDENMIVGNQNGSVNLYHNNSKKFETTSTGSQTEGLHLIKGHSDIDNQGSPLLFLQDSTNTNIKAVFLLEDDYTTGRGALAINVGESGVTNDRDLMLQKAGGRVGIRCAPTESFEVSGTSKFNGNITATGLITLGNELNMTQGIAATRSIDAFVGDAGTFRIRGTNSGDSGHQILAEFRRNAGVHLNHSGSTKLETTSYGLLISGNVQSNTIFPSAGNSFDLGTSTTRWRNIYTNDLNLSNEGGANDVDGTWGSYTIQEGAEDLFLVNKRSGKKYKFNLTEVT